MKSFIKRLFLLSSIAATAVLGAAKYSPVYVDEVTAGDQCIDSSIFVSIPNFLTSQKGFMIEFDFVTPSSTKTNTFNFMTSNWDRLTENKTMTFYSDGTVTTNLGKVFKRGDHYYFQVMMSELATCLNTTPGQIPTGNETLCMFYLPQCNVRLNTFNAVVIDSTINLSSTVSIRDNNKTGLNFKAHISKYSSSNSYGMIIAPNYYISRFDGDYIANLNTSDLNYIDLKCEPVALNTTDALYKEYGAGYFIQGSLTNIKSENYQLAFTAIPYEKTTEGLYKYGNFSKDSKASLYDICADEFESGAINSKAASVKTYANNVLAACENHQENQATNNVRAYFAKNTEKILKTAVLPSNMETSMNIEAAKNESESFQLILNANFSTSKKYYANIEPFVKTDEPNVKILSKNVSISKQLYVNVESNWDQYKYFGTQGYYHEGKEESDLGWYPDALLPFDLAVDNNENYLNNYNGGNNGLVFDVKVPETAKAGTYTSKVVIKIFDEGTIVLPVSLKVHNFALTENNSKYSILISPTEIGNVYGNAQNITSRHGSYYTTAYELMAKNGIGSMLPEDCWSMQDLGFWVEKAQVYASDPKIGSYFLPSLCQQVEASLAVSYKVSYSTKSKTISTRNENNKVLLVLTGKDYYSDKTLLPGYETLFKKMVEASTDNNDLFKKAVVYFPQADEPGSNESSHLQNILCQNVILHAIENTLNNCDFTGKSGVRNSLSKLPYIVTSYPRGLMNGKIVYNKTEYAITSYNNIAPISDNCADCYITNDLSCLKEKIMKGYCPTFDSFEQFSGSGQIGYTDIMNMLSNKDEYNIWWYGCCMPVSPFPMNAVNNKIIRDRVNKWLQSKYGVEGEIYYMCNRCSRIDGVEGEGSTETPLSESQILAGGCIYNGSYGDGQYIYPVHNKYKVCNSHVFWLSSLRLENLGEANDDYNYLYLVKDLISKLPSESQEAELTKVNNAINSIVGSSGPYYNTTDHNKLVSARQAIANLIDKLI